MKIQAIFGPPGTGKTRELVAIAEEEAKHINGYVLFLSYTRSAAQEAVSRIKNDHIKPSTLHSYAFNALKLTRSSVVDPIKLRSFSAASGIPFKDDATGVDEVQEGDDYLATLSYANNLGIPEIDAWDHYGRPGTRDRFVMFVTGYHDWKNTFGFMDFDDMLMKFVERGTGLRYPCVILDEAQDCSPLQWRAFNTITQLSERVHLAGDDDQAVYEWSGADPHGMRTFSQTGDVRILEQSHRCPRVVCLRAHGVINGIDDRVPKTWRARNSDGLCTRYGDIWNIDFSQFDDRGGGMVLVRDRFKLAELKRELNRSMVPYDVIGGGSPWTNQTAEKLRAHNEGKADRPQITSAWQSFYQQADLMRPVKITLSTIHQAKGREADRVLVDLSLPARVLQNLALDQDAERRVMYVALTRAREELILCGNNPIVI